MRFRQLSGNGSRKPRQSHGVSLSALSCPTTKVDELTEGAACTVTAFPLQSISIASLGARRETPLYRWNEKMGCNYFLRVWRNSTVGLIVWLTSSEVEGQAFPRSIDCVEGLDPWVFSWPPQLFQKERTWFQAFQHCPPKEKRSWDSSHNMSYYIVTVSSNGPMMILETIHTEWHTSASWRYYNVYPPMAIYPPAMKF